LVSNFLPEKSEPLALCCSSRASAIRDELRLDRRLLAGLLGTARRYSQ
jgi:hypothetical protein